MINIMDNQLNSPASSPIAPISGSAPLKDFGGEMSLEIAKPLVEETSAALPGAVRVDVLMPQKKLSDLPLEKDLGQLSAAVGGEEKPAAPVMVSTESVNTASEMRSIATQKEVSFEPIVPGLVGGRSEAAGFASVRELKNQSPKAEERKPLSSHVLRTYEADSADMIKTNRMSLTTIALKEAEKRQRTEEEDKRSSVRTIILSTLAFLFLATGGGIITYLIMAERQAINTTSDGSIAIPDPIVFSKGVSEVSVTPENKTEVPTTLSKMVREINLPPSAVQAIVMSDNLSGSKRLSTAETFAKLVFPRAPDRFVRLLSDEYMFGVYSGLKNGGFALFKTDSYQEVSAELLGWESWMAGDVFSVLIGRSMDKREVANKWMDSVVSNMNVREYQNPEQDARLVYGFLDEKTILIAANRETFKEILNSLNTPKPTAR